MSGTEIENVTIVGASAAGLSVAETLRRSGFGGAITLIGDEEHVPYDRPPLSKEFLAGHWDRDRVRLRDRAALAALELDLRLGARATGLDTAGRTVTLADGSRLGYDELVVATGVRPRRLPGTEGIAGVHVLRTLEDAEALRALFSYRPRVAVVGAGFLGAEAAAAATEQDCEVTLVSAGAAPMVDVLGEELGAMLAEVHAEHGVRVLADARATEVLSTDGRAYGVVLADGRRVRAEVVVVAIGSDPATDWLADSGLDVADGVRCDRYCRAAPGVWAAGDVAAWEHGESGDLLRLEHRTNAAEQGMAVARNILAGADPRPFSPVPYVWSDQYDLKIQIHGLPGGAEEVTITEGSPAERSLVALYGRADRVRAAVGVNRVRPVRQARKLVAIAAPWPSTGQDEAHVRATDRARPRTQPLG